MTDEEREELEAEQDGLMRLVHELRDELSEYDEDSWSWRLCLEDLSEAEDELTYVEQKLQEQGLA